MNKTKWVNMLTLILLAIAVIAVNPDSDLDSNGVVDGSDLTMFAFSFGKSAAKGNFIIGEGSDANKSDLNRDGIVDGSDLTVFAFDFNENETSISICLNGTLYSQCSTIKPKYCDNGNLVDKCSQCGCPSGQVCQADGSCAMPDTTPPTVQNTQLNPTSGLAGTIFTITTKVTDLSGISLVSAYVQNPDETNIAEIMLYDDGAHGDGAANDGVYGNIWDSTGKAEGRYYVDVYVEDTNGNFVEVDNAASFEVETNKCVTIINNGDPANKIDVVFVPDGYSQEELGIFVSESIPKYIGGTNGEGILYFEPFRSNKDRFNFHYINQPFTMNCLISGQPRDECTAANVYAAGSLCPFFDQIIVSSKTESNDAFASLTGNYLVVGTQHPSYEIGRVATHEFGHSFGGLNDEYGDVNYDEPEAQLPNCDVFGCPKWCSGTPTLPKPQFEECKAVNSGPECLNVEEECLTDKSFGCKKVYDCDKTKYPNGCACMEKCRNAQYTPGCEPRLSWPFCAAKASYENFGVGCIEGAACYQNCNGKAIFRSSYSSIMKQTEDGYFNIVSKNHINKIFACCYNKNDEEFESANCEEWEDYDKFCTPPLDRAGTYLFVPEDLADIGYDITGLIATQKITAGYVNEAYINIYVTEIENIIEISVVTGMSSPYFFDYLTEVLPSQGFDLIASEDGVMWSKQWYKDATTGVLLFQKYDHVIAIEYQLSDENKAGRLISIAVGRI